jgi:hypothetical protein
MMKSFFISGLLLYSSAFQSVFANEDLSSSVQSYYTLSYSDFKNALAKLNVSDVNCQASLGENPNENYQLTSKELGLIAKNEYGTMKASQLAEVLKSDKERKSYFIPLGLTDAESLSLVLAGSLGLVLFKNDQQLMNFTQDHKTKVTSKISKLGDLYGATLVPAIAAGSYVVGAVIKDDKIEQLGLFSIGALAAQSVVLAAVKTKAGRARPYADEGPNSFGNDGSKDKNQSFYSAHTAFAFTMAAVTDEVYGKDHPVVPYVAYGMATLVAWSRVHDRKHWASDVLLGAVAGKGITTLYINAAKGNPDGRGGLKITPLVGGPDGQLAVVAEWTEAEKNSVKKCKKSLEKCLEEALNK